MIIHLCVPRFWVIVEEQRRPDLRDRPVIIGDGFLTKTAAHSTVLMANQPAEACGVRAGISLANARHLCPEAVILSPELPLYQGIWDDVLAVLLAYTPLVESLQPGEAVCDVEGCERLFGEPVFLAREMVQAIQGSLSLPARAAVASNRLVAQLAAGIQATAPASSGASTALPASVSFVPAGGEAAFLAPLPIASLPDLDEALLLSFQVLGIKTVGQLASIPAAALERRFGKRGRRLAGYARGRDDRPVRPHNRTQAIRITHRLDDELDGMESHPDSRVALAQLMERMASELSQELLAHRLAGRLLALLVTGRRTLAPENARPGRRSPASREEAEPIPPWPVGSPPNAQLFPNQDSRIHSMLPSPRQPGRAREIAPLRRHATGTDAFETAEREVEPSMTVEAMARMATGDPVNDRRTLVGLANRLLARVLAGRDAGRLYARSDLELRLEMSQFAPPRQLLLPGLDPSSRGPMNDRLSRLNRQESILASRFGTTPFRHVEEIDLEAILEERKYRWARGITAASGHSPALSRPG